jgi:Protein of unknown function (DUF4239)
VFKGLVGNGTASDHILHTYRVTNRFDRSVQFVYDLPTVVFGPAFALLVMAVSIAGLLLVRRYASQGTLKEHNDITGFIIAVVGVIYAVVLAFLVIVVWEDFSHAEDNVQHEVDALTDIYHGAQVFPPAQRDRIRAAIETYNHLIVTQEWPAMQHGGASADADKVKTQITDDITNLMPLGVRAEDEHRELLQLTESFLDARRARLHQNEEGVPPLMWWTMAIGGTLTIGFSFLFGGVNRTQHIVMVALLSAIIAAMLVLVIEINLPFRGDGGVSDDIWLTQAKSFAAH